MKYFYTIISLAIVGGLIVGHYIKDNDPETGNFLIGLSISLLFFVLMPVFMYQRWKNKNVKDYMLTKENIEKMRDYRKEKDL